MQNYGMKYIQINLFWDIIFFNSLENLNMPWIEDALNPARWRVGVGEIAVRVGYIRSPPFTGINPDQNWIGTIHSFSIQLCSSSYQVRFQLTLTFGIIWEVSGLHLELLPFLGYCCNTKSIHNIRNQRFCHLLNHLRRDQEGAKMLSRIKFL